VGLSFTIHSDTVSAVVDRKRSAGLAIAIGVFVIWHGFSGTLILRAPLAAHPIGPAITTGMGAPITPNSPLLAASLLTSLLAWLACASILNYAKLR
jgi:pheromone shutdown protein TraB